MFVSSFFIYVLSLNLCFGQNLIETQTEEEDHITTRGQDRLFSGFYYPKNIHSMESYGAAWLAPRERVVNRMDRLEMIGDLEGATREMIRFGKETNLMTRDYFDFHVIHLSGTTNGVHNESADAFLMREIYKKLSVTTQILMEHTIRQNYTGSVAGDSRLMDETVALIPFSVSSASNRYKFNRHQEAIRLEYFTATFWSVHRYMKHIIVTVGLKKDLALLTQLHLPVWRIIDLSQYYDPDIDRFNPASRWFLPRRSMLYVANRLQNLPFREEPCDYAKQHLAHERESIDTYINSISFDGFKYVYYTEADQLVYIRSQKHIMDALDRQRRSLILTPHRMHTILLPSVYPHLDKYLTPPHRKVNLAHVKVITETPLEARGSCCDSGRFHFPSCGNFWYLCPKWGLNNYTDWVRYGPEGFVMPMGTVHQAKCTYSPYSRLCPIPLDCDRRFPTDQIVDATNYKPPKASAIDTPNTPLKQFKHVFWDEKTGRPYRYLPVCRERVAFFGE